MTWLALASSATGCAKPPAEAPTELKALGRFLFDRFEDVESEELDAGWRNLADYLASADLTSPAQDRSRTMSSLRPEDLGDLSLPEGASSDDQISVAIPGLSGFPVEDQVALATDAVQTCLEGRVTRWAGRTFLTDARCFDAGTCDRLETLTEVRREVSLFVNVWYDQFKTYRRFSVPVDPEDEGGETLEVLAGRAWIAERFEGDAGGSTLDQLFHLDVYVGDDDTTLRWFSMWSSVSGVPLGDDAYARLVVNGLEEALQFSDEVLGEVAEPECPHDRDAPRPE